MSKEIISCICMTCGIRNDHSNPTGYCQNDHDDWLEYRDVVDKNKFFTLAWQLAGSTPEEFTALFMNPAVKEIPMINRPTVIFQFPWLHSQNNMSEGGQISKITVCKWNGYFFYVREALNGIDQFNISSGERWGDKAGSVPRKARQTLEVLGPHWLQETIFNIVKLNDPLGRPVKWNRQFTTAWLEETLKKHDDGKYKYKISFAGFTREARKAGSSKK
jgi:hypothetical protein